MALNPTPEFRAEAVRVALTSGLPRKQVAADFGVGYSTLSRWIQQDRRNPRKPVAQSDLEREVAELRKENRMLREEREVLKHGGSGFYPVDQIPDGTDSNHAFNIAPNLLKWVTRLLSNPQSKPA